MRLFSLVALLSVSVLADEMRGENFAIDRTNENALERDEFIHAPAHAKVGVMADGGERHRVQRKPLHEMDRKTDKG